MSVIPDSWYVRFPDGRVVRADSTSAVRQHIGSGRIPPGSSVRRSADEEWVSLEWTAEFADLLKKRSSVHVGHDRPAGHGKRYGHPADSPAAGVIASRLDPALLHTVGVQGVLQELLAALDSTLVRKKLLVGLLAGLVVGALFALAPLLLPLLGDRPGVPYVVWGLAAALSLVVGAVAASLISRLTYVELARLRAARWREGTAGMGGTAMRLALAVLPVVGVAVALLWLLHASPGWLLRDELASWGPARETVAAVLAVLAQVVGVLIVPWCLFALLLAPVLVVEGGSIVSAWSQWWRLLRQHRARALSWEALAVSFGIVASLPLGLPWLVVANLDPGPTETARLAVAITRQILAALALVPLTVYLIVANVFIYLNLRYEASSGQR
jgi:hypothetical protein